MDKARLTLFEHSELSRNLKKAVNRVCTESWILEIVLKFAQQFSRRGKRLENRDIPLSIKYSESNDPSKEVTLQK